MKERWKVICSDHVDKGCSMVCPLACPCKFRVGDTKETHNDRMKYHADLYDKRKTV